MSRPLVALAAAPWHVLVVRVADRIGKGVRTSPRDALIANATHPSMRARAFGFHRAMDHAGAAIGTLLGAGLLWHLGAAEAGSAGAVGASAVDQLRAVFLWAGLPGAVAMVALALTPEPARPSPSVSVADAEQRRSAPLPPSLKRALVPVALFAFANATDAFTLVKAARLGASPVLAPLLWLALHLVKAATTTTGGRLADRHGKRNALALGWAVYAVTWSAVGLVESLPLLFALTALYGTSHGLVEGVEKALVAELAPSQRRGSAFGAYHLLVGLAALASNVTFGAVWDLFGSTAAFAGSGAVALAAAIALLALVSNGRAAGAER